MGRIFKTTKYSNYLGEYRPLLDIDVQFIQDTPTPTPSVTPTITPTASITPSITPTISLTPTNTLTPTPSPTPNIGQSLAIDFMTQVTNTGGTIDSITSAATITFFESLVTNNLYDKILWMYPFIGGTKNSMSLNAIKKSSGFPVWGYPFTFYNFGYSSSGVTGNGTSSYGDVVGTSFQYPQTWGLFIGTDSDGDYCDLSGTGEIPFDADSGTAFYSRNSDTMSAQTGSRITNTFTTSNTDSRGLYFNGRISSSSVDPNVKYYKNGSLIGQKNEGPERQSADAWFLGCLYYEPSVGPDVYSKFSDRLYQFFIVMNRDLVLSDSEISTLSGLINTYQQQLGRYSY